MTKPDSIWYAGDWRTPGGVERKRRGNRERQRIYQGSPAGAMTEARRRIKRKEEHLGS